MSASDLQAVLGIELTEAEALLAAADGNMEVAVSLFYDDGSGAGGNREQPDSNQDNSEATVAAPMSQPQAAGEWSPPYPHWSMIWPKEGAVPASWAAQSLHDVRMIEGFPCLVQAQNGPCGVLCVVQAWLWILGTKETKVAIAQLLRCIPSSHGGNKIMLFDGSVCDLEQGAERIHTAQELVETVVLTRGVEAIRSYENFAAPLVEGPFFTCSSCLMTLLLSGDPTGNFSAYRGVNSVPFYTEEVTLKDSSSSSSRCSLRPGLLTIDELQEGGMPVPDDLKNPASGVWLVHSGDHFTTAMAQPSQEKDNNSGSTKEAAFLLLWHYNGLPPAGPHLQAIRIFGDTTFVPAPSPYVETYRKPRPGQLEDIVQAKKITADKYGYCDWWFEVLPAIEDPSYRGLYVEDETVFPAPAAPLALLASKVDLPADWNFGWRCVHCYHNRYQTMCFGLNEAEDGTHCKHCNAEKKEGNFTFWMLYADLPRNMKNRVRQMYAPKIELILGTRFQAVERFEYPPDGKPPM